MRRRGPFAGVVLALCLLVVPAAGASVSLPAAKTRYAKVAPVCAPPAPGDAACAAFVREAVPASEAGSPGVTPYALNDGADTSGPAGGLTPKQLETAYGYDSLSGGSAQTVAIVDAYNDPGIEHDLGEFDANYGLSPCTRANGCFTEVSQTGTASLPTTDSATWALEMSLDVEMVHSACANCKILLVEANSASFSDLSTAVNTAVSLGATEVSNSYGGPEGELSPAELDAFSHPGVVIAAATGDSGYDDWTYYNEGEFPPERPNVPAALPSVVSVGGTTLGLDGSGKRASETVWNGNGPDNDSVLIEGATGGGCSLLFSAPPWQPDTPGYGAAGCGGTRLAADISADADPISGVAVYDSFSCGACKNGKAWIVVGGTSLATPLISAMYALAGGANGASDPAVAPYGHLGDSADLFDVTEGGNGWCDAAPESSCGHPDAFDALVPGFALHVDCEYTTACDAAPGYDGPSGVGTPNGLGAFKPLLPTAAITPPSSATAGLVAGFSGTGSSDPYRGGSVASYRWSWGDGTTGSGATPTHVYAEAGDYTVGLTVTDAFGVTGSTVEQAVKVAPRSAEEVEDEKKAKEEEKEKEKEKEPAPTKPTEPHEVPSPTPAPAAGQAPATAGVQQVSAFQTTLAPAIPDAQLAGEQLQVGTGGAVTLKISCPAGESSCSGSITLRSLEAVSSRSGRAPLTLASGSFTVPGGQVRAVTLHLSAKARVLLARSRTLRARTTLLAHDPQGAHHTTVTLVTLRAPRAHAGKG